jgi:hypothetical protein
VSDGVYTLHAVRLNGTEHWVENSMKIDEMYGQNKDAGIVKAVISGNPFGAQVVNISGTSNAPE